MIGMVGAGIILLAIFCNPALSGNPFKQYIVYLCFTDFFFSAFCTQCFFNYVAGRFLGGDVWCDLQAWYVIFGYRPASRPPAHNVSLASSWNVRA